MPDQQQKVYVNLGCGSRCRPGWINVDKYQSNKEIKVHNLLERLPFKDNTVDFIYSSHVLEHFRKSDAHKYLIECLRVLVPGGAVRIVVPDFENMAKIYLEKLEKAINGDNLAQSDYDWILLEMFDQMIRDKQGGEMLKYLLDKKNSIDGFLLQRMGSEGMQYLNFRNISVAAAENKEIMKNRLKQIVSFVSGCSIRKMLKRLVLGSDYKLLEEVKFRNSGEIHLWMYDRFSLQRMLKQAGFINVCKQTAFTSILSNWTEYNLDTEVDGQVYKPGSLYMEARRP